jgi:transglutaminase-like putative cysteine protease
MSDIRTTMLVAVGCEFIYETEGQAPSIFLVRPAGGGPRIRSEGWATVPHLPYHDYTDLYGNQPRRLTLPTGRCTVRYDAQVEISAEPDDIEVTAVEHPVEDLPDDVLMYTLPSRFCLSDELSDEAWERFGGIAPGWGRVQAVCDWVHGTLNFAYGTSLPLTTAVDALRARTGVCRDFAHLAVTFCRALNIPSRYVFGYLPDIDVPPPDSPMDFCAWFEAFLSGRWWTFDPRNNQRRIGHIVIARGRDALDVAMVTSFGAARLDNMTVWADRVA